MTLLQGERSGQVVLRQQRATRCRQQGLALGVGAQGAGQLQRPHQGAGNHHRLLRCARRWQSLAHHGDKSTHALGRWLQQGRRLAVHFRSQGRDHATAFNLAQVGIGKIGFDQGPQGILATRLALTDATADQRRTVMPGTHHGLGQESIARREVSVKTAMGQACLLHHVSHTHTCIALASQGARCHLNDALVGGFAAAGFAWHGESVAKYDERNIFVWKNSPSEMLLSRMNFVKRRSTSAPDSASTTIRLCDRSWSSTELGHTDGLSRKLSFASGMLYCGGPGKPAGRPKWSNQGDCTGTASGQILSLLGHLQSLANDWYREVG